MNENDIFSSRLNGTLPCELAWPFCGEGCTPLRRFDSYFHPAVENPLFFDAPTIDLHEGCLECTGGGCRRGGVLFLGARTV